MALRRIVLCAWLACLTAACSSDDKQCQPGSVVCRLPEIEWKTSLEIGGVDSAGNRIGGTEIRSLVEFDGKLFAGNGIWMDTEDLQPGQPGPQVFVLDRPESEGGAWNVDFELSERIDLDGRHRYQTISVMESVNFHKGADGSDLGQPVSLLVTGFWDRLDATEVFTRDVAGVWNRITLLEPGTCRRQIRSFGLHRDGVTGADMLFAGTSGREDCPTQVYSGVYDSGNSAGISFSQDPEPWAEAPGVDDRVTSFAVANDQLYATVCGKVYQRQDGPDPFWKLIFAHQHDFCPAGPGENGFRGATVVDGDRSESLVVAMEGWLPHIGRVDLLPDITHQEELDTRAFLGEAWEFPATYIIVAYNDMTPFEMPSRETVLLMGLEASTPDDPQAWNSWAPQAWYFIRYPDKSYELREIVDESIQPKPTLVSTRTFHPSPFESEKGRVIYAGGFDANHQSCHDTAWLYRGQLKD